MPVVAEEEEGLEEDDEIQGRSEGTKPTLPLPSSHEAGEEMQHEQVAGYDAPSPPQPPPPLPSHRVGKEQQRNGGEQRGQKDMEGRHDRRRSCWYSFLLISLDELINLIICCSFFQCDWLAMCDIAVGHSRTVMFDWDSRHTSAHHILANGKGTPPSC